MKLYEQKTTYNPRPLIEGAIDLSKFHFSQDWRKHSIHPTENMVTIGLGRQTGQTTAIRDILLDNKKLRDETIVLTFKHSFATSAYRKYGINAMGIEQINSIRDFVMGKNRLGIIFDTCSGKQIIRFFNESYYLRILNFLVNIGPVLTH